MTDRKKWLLFFVALAFAVFSRFFVLDARPLHHDEGNNFHFTNILLQTGSFFYNPENFHGPTYFFALFLSFLAFGISEYSLRFPAALFGIFLGLLPFFMKFERKFPFFLAALFLLASPSLTYYARYSIHETLFTLLGILLLYTLTRFTETKNFHYLPYAAFFLALLLATKETSMITLAVILPLIIVQCRDWLRLPWRENRSALFASLYIFGLMYVALFSSFFTHLSGVADSFSAFAPWIARSGTDIGHIKPWHYYLVLITSYEAPILFLGLLGTIIGFFQKNALIKNLGLFAFGQLLIYSVIPYKMPWLVINITASLAIVAGYGLWSIPWKKTRIALFLLAFALLLPFNLYLNFLHPWQEDNWYAYVHSDIEILALNQRIHELTDATHTIAMTSDVYWPLPFYLRDRKVEYFSDIQTLDYSLYESYQVIIAHDKTFDPSNLPAGYAVEKFLLRKNTVLDVIYKEKKE